MVSFQLTYLPYHGMVFKVLNILPLRWREFAIRDHLSMSVLVVDLHKGVRVVNSHQRGGLEQSLCVKCCLL